MNDGIDQPLVSGSSIFQPNWHHTVMVGASVDDEGCVFLVRRVHQNLVVSREGIHEIEHLMAGRGVNQQIYARKRIAVFRASSVEVGVVDTKSPFTIIFTNQNHIRQPSGIVHICDKLCLKELIYFRSNKVIALRVKDTLLLADGSEMELNVETVGDEGGVNTWHVGVGLGKYVVVLNQKGGEVGLGLGG